jgi:ABC-type multidrug transport system fused ATPase/permease subunit
LNNRSILRRCLEVYSRQDRPKIIAVIVLQVLLSLLDLAGVAAIGVLGALAVTGVQSQAPGERVARVLEILKLGEVSFQAQVASLSLLASALLMTRTLLSIQVTKRIFFFLSRRGALVTAELFSKLLSRSILTIQSRSMQEHLYSLTSGVSSVTLGVLASLIAIVADSSLLIVLLLGLFYVDVFMAISTLVFFGSLGAVLYRVMNTKAQKLGVQNSELTIRSNQKIIEALETFRESLVRNRRGQYTVELKDLRIRLADVLAEMQFMPNVSKYIIELALILGGLLIASSQFIFQDASQAVSALAVFLAAGSRIAPAVMRIQQSSIQLRLGLGAAKPTLDLLDQLQGIELPEISDREINFDYAGFRAKIELRNVTLKYPDSKNEALKEVSMMIEEGQSIAIVGPSGAGKTSLVDVLLGVLEPTTGFVRISGCSPAEAVSRWPGAIAYVPQDVTIVEGSFRENVALGYPSGVATDEIVWSALEQAQLSDFVASTEFGLDTLVGQGGAKLSGGQRQRLGIARAFFTRPILIVLDEATSALDGFTENELTSALSGLKRQITLVTIAHRLSTVKDADCVYFMDNGEVIASGTFEELKERVPRFAEQANLMGL